MLALHFVRSGLCANLLDAFLEIVWNNPSGQKKAIC
jgi:hypothetical protein